MKGKQMEQKTCIYCGSTTPLPLLDAVEVGMSHERDRIIKLLEEQKKIYSSPKYSTTGGFLEQFALDSAIALIKGEK